LRVLDASERAAPTGLLSWRASNGSVHVAASAASEKNIHVRTLTAILVGLAVAIAGAAHAKNSSPSHSHHSGHKGPAATGTSGVFDYYVMALSWSPTYCELHPEEEEQCSHKGYGFVLHGLWPQYEDGGGPEHCPTTDEPDRKTVANALAFMPSKPLITHEWMTHGACTGLDPTAYFALADRAFAAVHVPPQFNAPHDAVNVTSDQFRSAFKDANANLDEETMSIHCTRGEFVELRVCLDKNLSPRACGKRMQSRCPATAEFAMPASR
jgi:ribonuclease T2